MPKFRKTLGGKSRKSFSKKSRSTRMRRNKKNIKFGGAGSYPKNGTDITNILDENFGCNNFEETTSTGKHVNKWTRSELELDTTGQGVRMGNANHMLVGLCP